MRDKLIVKGAREHNLQNVDVELPRDKLTVVSGVSGSGKSSLVFDTIFAEGQRRYVESLSAYARQFLGRVDKPDVDYIEGLSPAISIEQKTTARNPRSTVGTVTEIYDYLRLLFARVGKAYCPKDGSFIAEQSLDQIVDSVLSIPAETKILLLAPVVKARKGEHDKTLTDAKSMGFARVRVDGVVLSLDEEIKLEKNKKHDIDIVVDRIKIEDDSRKRVAEAIESAVNLSGGTVLVAFVDAPNKEDLLFSEHAACPVCGFSIPDLQPRLFSFNNPQGACPDCSGLGVTLEFDPALIMPDPTLSFEEGGFAPYSPTGAWYRSLFVGLSNHYGFALDTPVKDLPAAVIDVLVNGSGKEKIQLEYTGKEGSMHFSRNAVWDGFLADLRRRYRETSSDPMRVWLESFMRERRCETCKGKRLRPEALSVRVGDKNIFETTQMNIEEQLTFFKSLEWSPTEEHISKQILKEIIDRLRFMSSVGLSYLTLERQASTLSGGEAQRIRLATQIGSSLVGVLYILDEPTIGLHQRDNDRLIGTLKRLRDLGNTLVVVEHDEQLIRDADYLVDVGPGAGIHGGRIVAAGTPDEVALIDESPTGRFLSGKDTIDVPASRRPGTGKFLEIINATEHNLRGISVRFPVGAMSVITGVSGSGKSTLLTDVMYPAINNAINRSRLTGGAVESVTGIENFDSCISIDQDPIGRTPRSNPATYVGVWTPIRDIFAATNESKARGYKSGRFSFNVKGGRCEACEGSGVKKIEMHFLPDVFVVCDVCSGKRFNRETLDVRYKGRHIAEILDMTVEEAAVFFDAIPSIKRKLGTLVEVGLGYITLGQSALTLSGGEAQRVKLALELSRRGTGRTIYIIDEPTTGLHFLDVKKLMESLQRLVDMGNTMVMIEHNLDVIKCADYLVDLGPEGGSGGGLVLVTGSPEEVAACEKSFTGRYLEPLLKK